MAAKEARHQRMEKHIQQLIKSLALAEQHEFEAARQKKIGKRDVFDLSEHARKEPFEVSGNVGVAESSSAGNFTTLKKFEDARQKKVDERDVFGLLDYALKEPFAESCNGDVAGISSAEIFTIINGNIIEKEHSQKLHDERFKETCQSSMLRISTYEMSLIRVFRARGQALFQRGE